MSDNNDLKRAAEAVLAMDYPWEHTVRDGRLGKTSTEYARLAHPLSVRALIVENERLTGCIVQRRAQAEQYDQALIKMDAERDRLRAEVAGLKTGYEAYEQVNAELKAENEALRGAGAGALRFVAFAFDEGVEGAELAGRAIEDAIGAKS
ncbi:hypothetical protein PS834_03033 [Pseudomonas fluorescens]|nr:hypothetical protein PS834_03033 [Pseudomonas fluorescens]